MHSKRRFAGKIAKIMGDEFENILLPWANQAQAKLLRIPNGCKTVRFGRITKLVRVKSPFDFVLTKSKQAVFFDAKTTAQSTFTYSAINKDQVDHLIDMERQGFLAGYMIEFRGNGRKVAFFRASQLLAVRKRESVTHDMGFDLGSTTSLYLSRLFLDSSKT